VNEKNKVHILFKKLIIQPEKWFPKNGYKLEATTNKGVYIILKGKEVLHVGSTPRAKKGILQRLCNHLRGQSSFTGKYLKGNGSELRAGYCFKCLPVEDNRTRVLLENYAIGVLCPKHIGEGQHLKL